eukprot:4007878-Amphidinium_carterae.1
MNNLHKDLGWGLVYRPCLMALACSTSLQDGNRPSALSFETPPGDCCNTPHRQAPLLKEVAPGSGCHLASL